MRDHWRDEANCKGKSGLIFFPDHRILNEARWDIPRAFCDECVVRQDCLDMVLQYEDTDDRWGMFGGLTPVERREVRYKRKGLK